jgi:hypothetical protein
MTAATCAAVSTAHRHPYANGNSASASTAATLGTLHAVAEANVPLSDQGHNLQSSASVRMQDTLLASSSLGSLFNNYQYTVKISGSTTLPSDLFATPAFSANASVNLNIFDNTTFKTLVHTTWEAPSNGGPANVVLTGSILGVGANDQISFDLTLSVGAGVNPSAANQSGFARADFGNTVHFYFDALTPGANTVAQSGQDYAAPAPVPLPATFGMLFAGSALSVTRRRRSSHQARNTH